jgi:hypothetical protein
MVKRTKGVTSAKNRLYNDRENRFAEEQEFFKHN